jgi:hypothetical protein
LILFASVFVNNYFINFIGLNLVLFLLVLHAILRYLREYFINLFDFLIESYLLNYNLFYIIILIFRIMFSFFLILILIHLFIDSLSTYHFFIDIIISLNVILICYQQNFYISILNYVNFILNCSFIFIIYIFYSVRLMFKVNISYLIRLFVKNLKKN